MTTYVVLRESSRDSGLFGAVDQSEAANAEQACRRAAERMSDDDLADGITLIAVPLRNWTTGRNMFKAETRRRLLLQS